MASSATSSMLMPLARQFLNGNRNQLQIYQRYMTTSSVLSAKLTSKPHSTASITSAHPNLTTSQKTIAKPTIRISETDATVEGSLVLDSINPFAVKGAEKEELIHDFTAVVKSASEPVDERFVGVEASKRPVVLIFGWAGATDKNMDKYAQIYRQAGCTTLSYILPSRFIFLKTVYTPLVSQKIIELLKTKNLSDRPVFIHNFSDTGLMVYQGLDDVMNRFPENKLNIKGMVFDSCPGPRPQATFGRITALIVVNWITCGRDGYNTLEKIYSTINLWKERGWPNIPRRFKGLDLELSVINGKWSGDFTRDQLDKTWPELFFYSKTDYYLPWKYVEKEVLEKRKKAGKDLTIQKWAKSAHVGHLREHKKEYTEAILKFLDKNYFAKLK